MFFWGISFAPQAIAASCECFCGDVKQGAGSIGGREDASTCAAECADGGATYVGCFADEASYPENSNLCWTEKECNDYPIKIGGDTYKGTWSDQNPYCSKQSVTGAEMGYCYGPLLPVTLNVPILGVTQVSNLGTYVNLVYTYAIPVAGIFGALMFTIAGFQYMTAGGNKNAVAKAKGRMANTATAIILLMSVYAIAYLIDPRLTRFNELRPPLVKKAVMVDDATTCEALFGYGFCIDGTCPSDGKISGTCGQKGTISGDDEINLNIANPPEVGDDCMYSGCDDKSKSCVIKGDNSGGTCVSCAEVSALNSATGLTASSSVCSQIASQAQKRATNDKHVYSCYFDDDFSEFSGADGVGADECVALYTEGRTYIDCYFLEDVASDLEDGCGAYEYVEADSYGVDLSGGIADILNYGSADQIEDFKNVFGSMCEQDACKLADKGEVKQGSCRFVDSNWVQDVFDNFTGFGAFDVFDDYACSGSVTLTP
jgi:hypothetical protein